MYVAWKNTIREYSIKTGKLISEFKGIVHTIVGFAVHYYDSHECITACSFSGDLITWKINTHFKLLHKVCNVAFDSILKPIMISL